MWGSGMSHFACWTGGVLCGIAAAFGLLWAAETADPSWFWRPLP